MMFDNQEQDCMVYIEELKSDAPDLKINAVSKVAAISDILGKQIIIFFSKFQYRGILKF